MFKAELNELLTRELAEDGYSGVEVRRTSTRTEIIIRATRPLKVLGMFAGSVGRLCVLYGPQDTNSSMYAAFVDQSRFITAILTDGGHNVVIHGRCVVMRICCAGEKSRRIRELTSIVQKRFKFADGAVELYAEKVMNRGLCAVAQAESLRYKLLGGLAVRRCGSFWHDLHTQ